MDRSFAPAHPMLRRAPEDDPVVAGTVTVVAGDDGVARAAREVLRRAGFRIDRTEAEAVSVGELTVDTARHEVRVAGRSIDLTAMEYRVLVALARRPGWVVAPDQLLREAWGDEYEGAIDYLRPIISRLRRKLADDRRRPPSIETVRGFGYRLRLR